MALVWLGADRQACRQEEALTVLRSGLWGLRAAFRQTDRCSVLWIRLRPLWNIKGTQAAANSGRCREDVEIGGADGGSGPSSSRTRGRPSWCGSREWTTGGRGGWTPGFLPLWLFFRILPGFYNNVQTAANAAWPQRAWPLQDRQSFHRSAKQSVPVCPSWSIQTGRSGWRQATWRQTVWGGEELLPAQIGRVIQDGFHGTAPGLMPQRTSRTQTPTTSSQMVRACAGSASFQRHWAGLKLPPQHLSHGWLCLIAAPLSEQRQEEALGGEEGGLGWRGSGWKVGLLSLAPLVRGRRGDIAAKHWEQEQRQKKKKIGQSVQAMSMQAGC